MDPDRFDWALDLTLHFDAAKGGQTAILVRWSAAQRTTEMLADQRTGKNSGPAPADYRNLASASPLLKYLSQLTNFLDSSLNMNNISSI